MKTLLSEPKVREILRQHKEARKRLLELGSKPGARLNAIIATLEKVLEQ